MRTSGTILIALSLFIFLAAFADRFGPALQDRGIPLSGGLVPAAFWIPAGIVALIAGIILRRRATQPAVGIERR